MPKDWTKERFGDVIDFTPKIKLKKGEIYDFIPMENVDGINKFPSRINKKIYSGGGSKFSNGDTIFARITPCLENRKTAKVKGLKGDGFGSTEFLVFRPNGKSDCDFIYYLSQSDIIRERAIKSMSGASGRQRADKQVILDTVISLPPLPTQKRIASILGAFDDLIENNTRRIQILEEMAQAIYTEWFVKFKFPGHENATFYDSGTEYGEVPEGWEVRKLFDVVDKQYGYAFKGKDFNNEGYGNKVVRIRDLKKSNSTTFSTQDCDEKYNVENGDILVGMDGDFHMCKWTGGSSRLVQRVVKFIPKNEYGNYFCFLSIKPIIGFFNNTIVGTTVAHLSDRDLKKSQILTPSKSIMKRLNSLLEPIFSNEVELKIRNQTLQELRDNLLPKLVSGEVELNSK